MEQRVTDIQIIPVRPNNGLVGFASFVLDNSFYMGAIGIHTRPHGGFRVSYPTRKISSDNLPTYYPINKEIAGAIEQAIIAKFENVAMVKTPQD